MHEEQLFNKLPKIALGTALDRYESTLRSFIAGETRFDDFETAFFEMYKSDRDHLDWQAQGVLGSFFIAVDSTVENPADRDPKFHEISPEELRERAIELLREGGYQV